MKFPSKPHSNSIEQVIEGFKTSSQSGLTFHEVLKRQKFFGKNEIEEEKVNYVKIFFHQMSNFLVYVLIAASLISLITGKYLDFFTIFIIILINTFIGFWMEVKAEVSIKTLKKLTKSKQMVIRDGKSDNIESADLVPGDLVLLFEGSVITSDLRIIDSSSLMIDESSITGESFPVEKDHLSIMKEDTLEFEQDNMAFAGSTVVRGTAKGIVVSTGKSTYFNALVQRAQESSPQSTLTKSLNYFTKYYIGSVFVLLLIVGIVAYFQQRNIFDIAYILIAELVSAVPEGLAMVVTLVMVIGALALSRKKTYVRHLPAVETLGNATVIAADKTGTITEGVIHVQEVYAIDDKKLKIVAGLCNDSHGNKGDPVDVALAIWSFDISKMKDKYPRIWGYAFDSTRRIMATAHQIDGSPKILIKGAYEELKKIALNKADFENLETHLMKMSSEGLRVLALGEGDFISDNIDEAKITIVGLIGFLDPPKENVRKAVMAASKAGIKVIMITGDYALTAKAIAEQVGIYHKKDLMLTGEEIEKMSDEEFSEKVNLATVFARILPEHKYKIVKILQQAGEIVAVTGDGVNDVPALKKADLSIAMGGGTEAAKSVSKMIITDNNLNVIVDAVRNGRIIVDNLRKLIYYLISSSIMEMFFIFFSIILWLPLPLTAIQILWINIVTGGVQDKSFPFAKEEDNVMDRPPRKKSNQFFDAIQIFRLLFYGLPMGIILLELYKYLLVNHVYEESLTICFTSVVMAQLFNGIQSQKQKDPFFKNIKKSFTINPYIFIGVGFGILLQFFAVYVADEVFHTVPLPLKFWKYPVAISLISFFIVECRKWIEVLHEYLKKRNKGGYIHVHHTEL